MARFDASVERTPAIPTQPADGAPADVAPAEQPGEPARSYDAAFLADLFARKHEFLENDRFASIGDADSFYTKIVGVSFEGRQDLLGGLTEGAPLELQRQPENEFDANAIAVRYGTLQLGFLRREIARRLAPNIDAGDRYAATVGSLTGGGERHRGVNIFVRRERVSAPPASRDGMPSRDGATADQVRRALIGNHALHDAQKAVIARVRAGRNTLAVLGTGRGKSLCFQLPATELALGQGRKTLVFYPLRALANDQHDSLVRRLGGFGLRILRANGSIDGNDRADLDAALRDGSWDFMLATPEFATYHRDAFERPENRPSLIVIDEAHHVFESRHRAAYASLGELVRGLGAPQVLALTATAGDAAFAAIRRELAIDAWVIDPTVRENLHVVDARNTSDKAAYLARELDAGGKAIVYCTSRSEVVKVADRLRTAFGETIAFYHAGVPNAERMQVEDLFRRGGARIVVATSAFGEGIDLPDVRDVVLYHLNFDFTEFNQMAGRAGRDGAAARIHLLYGDGDRRINDYIIARDAPSLPVLRELYRGMRALARDGVVRMSYDDIVGALAVEPASAKTIAAAARVFAEAGLVESGQDDDGRFIRFRDVTGKTDVTQTAAYAEGAAEREAFDRFCALALGADAESLETIINRPIYPDRVPFET